jgi:hypothetical protein
MGSLRVLQICFFLSMGHVYRVHWEYAHPSAYYFSQAAEQISIKCDAAGVRFTKEVVEGF